MFSRSYVLKYGIWSFLLWLVFDIFFIHHGDYQRGISMFVFQVLFLWFLYEGGAKKKQTYDRVLIVATIFLAILSAWYALYNNTSIASLNIRPILFLDMFILLYMTNISQHIWKSISSIIIYMRSLITIKAYLPASWKLLRDQVHIWKLDKTHIQQSKNIAIWVWVLALFLIIILPLLSSADPIFEKTLQTYIFDNLNIFQHIHISEFLTRAFVTVLFGLLFWNLLVAVQSMKAIEAKDSESKIYRFFDDTTRGYIILWGINLVYILFCAIQFKYLFFGSHELIIARGFESYAAYIHRGFYELVCIAGLNYIIYHLFFLRKADIWRSRIAKRILLILLIWATLIMLISAYIRIHMYVQAYG